MVNKKFEEMLHFVTVFLLPILTSKSINILCSIGSISKPIASFDHNATDKTTAMGRYQNYFRKLDNLFSGKQQGVVRTDKKNYSFPIHFF